MSSIVRLQLEQFISLERAAILRALRDARVAAIERRDHNLSTKLEELENAMMSFMPLRPAFPTPDKYIDALRSFALALAFITSLFQKAEVNEDTLSIAKRFVEITREVTEVTLIVEDARRILSGRSYGHDVFIEGCKRYVSLLAGKVKEFGKLELHIVREALMELFSSGKPIRRLSELVKDFGVNERDLLNILKIMPDIDPNIVVGKKYIAIKDKLKTYVENLMVEKGYILVNDQARELSLEPELVVDAVSKIRDEIPDMRILEGKIIYVPSSLASHVENLTRESVILFLDELARRLNLDSKLAAKILEDIGKYFSEAIIISGTLVNKQRIVSWISEVFKDRPAVFIDEIIMFMGADKKTAREILELTSVLSKGDIILKQNRVIYRPNVVKLLENAMKERVLPEDMMALKDAYPELVESAIYARVHQELSEFEKNVIRRG